MQVSCDKQRPSQLQVIVSKAVGVTLQSEKLQKPLAAE